MQYPTLPRRAVLTLPTNPLEGALRPAGLLRDFAQEYRKAMAVSRQSRRLHADLARAVALAREGYVDKR